MAATAFYYKGRTDVAEIRVAHELLNAMLGSHLAPILFAVALIAAGQSSTITGTLAGQIVMEGYLRLRINPWMRRLLTRLVAIIPALIVILIKGEEDIDSLLILSQVILSLQLGFAVIPLIYFVSDRATMGDFVIKPAVRVLAWLITAVLVYLNLRMVSGQAIDFFAGSGHLLWKGIIIAGGLLYVFLLVMTIGYPLLRRQHPPVPVLVHPEAGALELRKQSPVYQRVAVALDFGPADEKLIGYALGHAGKKGHLILIHIVESVPARVYGTVSDDLETRTDQQKLDAYVAQLAQAGIGAESLLGFKDRASEIARLVRESGAGLLIIGAHRHKGVADWVLGETIDAVRHQLTIPVLIVNV